MSGKSTWGLFYVFFALVGAVSFLVAVILRIVTGWSSWTYLFGLTAVSCVAINGLMRLARTPQEESPKSPPT